MRSLLVAVMLCSGCGGSTPSPAPAAPPTSSAASATPVAPVATPEAPASTESATPASSASATATAATATAAPETPAGAPKLSPVDTGGPLKLSAPAGWRVKTMPPKHKDLSTIASLGPECAGGPDITVMIQLDQNMKSGAQVLADQYKGAKPTPMKGFDCVVRDANTEVMCAGKLKGLPGVISVYFATTDAAAYKRLDPAELTSSVAASLAWNGKVADLKEWSRPAGAEAKASCPKTK
jgi:hypothetical protein